MVRPDVHDLQRVKDIYSRSNNRTLHFWRRMFPLTIEMTVKLLNRKETNMKSFLKWENAPTTNSVLQCLMITDPVHQSLVFFFRVKY